MPGERGIGRFRQVGYMLMVGLAACTADQLAESSGDKAAFSNFEPIGQTEFRYVAKTYFDMGEPDARIREDSDQERVRLAWLGQYLNLNHMCLNGYEITRRTPVVITKEPWARHAIYYYGKCK